jgi:hypothetical protein
MSLSVRIDRRANFSASGCRSCAAGMADNRWISTTRRGRAQQLRYMSYCLDDFDRRHQHEEPVGAPFHYRESPRQGNARFQGGNCSAEILGGADILVCLGRMSGAIPGPRTRPFHPSGSAAQSYLCLWCRLCLCDVPAASLISTLRVAPERMCTNFPALPTPVLLATTR